MFLSNLGRYILVLLSLLIFVGCQNGYRPLWSGPSQIPPPQTGSVRDDGRYYESNETLGPISANDSPRISRRTRFSSETQRRRNSAKEPDQFDTNLDTTSTEDEFNSPVTVSDDLPWRPHPNASVRTATFESSRFRPSVSR